MDKAKETILDTFDDNEIDAEEIDFNDFKVLLGKGGHGEVFLVQQSRFKRAAKVVSLRGLQEEKRRKLYEGVRKELSTMCRVDRCDNIVRVFGVVRNIPDKLVLIMEYASKGSLRDYLDNEKDNPLPKEEVLNLVYDIVNGMKYIYSKNVEHRDLKTDNVLLDTYQGNLVAKVCDFGLSKADALITSASSKSSKVGTPAWQSPEELDDEDVVDDEKCDVYSFGITIFEIITCKLPWENIKPSKIMTKVLMKQKRPEYDKELIISKYDKLCVELIEACWLQDPNERPTFSEIVDKIKIFHCLIKTYSAYTVLTASIGFVKTGFKIVIKSEIFTNPVTMRSYLK